VNYLQLDNTKCTVLKYLPVKSKLTLKPGLDVVYDLLNGVISNDLQ